MTKSITKLVGVTLAAALAALPAPAATSTATPAANKLDSLLGDPVIAKAKGIEIKRSQLDAEMIKIQAQASAAGQSIPPENLPLVQRQKLNDLITYQILLSHATDADKAKGKEQFQKALQRLKTDNKLTDAELEEKLAENLKKQGVTRADWEKQNLEQKSVEAVLIRELKIQIGDEQARKFYGENPTKFEQPEQVRASHVLISTKDAATGLDLTDEQKKDKRKQIDELRKRAVAGEDFGKLAREFSEDPGSKDSGGEYTFPRGRMVPEFEAAAFSLNTNQVSDVVTTSYGYHIIKLSEKRPAKIVSYDEVADDLKMFLTGQEVQKQLTESDFLEKLRKDAGLEILDEKLKKLDETLGKADKPAASANPKN